MSGVVVSEGSVHFGFISHDQDRMGTGGRATRSDVTGASINTPDPLSVPPLSSPNIPLNTAACRPLMPLNGVDVGQAVHEMHTNASGGVLRGSGAGQ